MRMTSKHPQLPFGGRVKIKSNSGFTLQHIINKQKTKDIANQEETQACDQYKNQNINANKCFNWNALQSTQLLTSD